MFNQKQTMNNIIKTISFIILAALAVIALAFAFSGTAFAAGEIANRNLGFGQDAGGNGECPMVMIGNHTTQAGVIDSYSELCWANSIPTVNAGETINVLVKVKNLGPDNISNTTIRFSNNGSSTPVSSHSFTVTTNANGAAAKTGTVSFNLRSAQTITYIGHSYAYIDGRTGNVVASRSFEGNNFFGGPLFPIGNVQADDYGYMYVAFEIGRDRVVPPINNENPWVELIVDDNTLDEGDNLFLRWDVSDVVRCDFDSSPNTQFEYSDRFPNDPNYENTLTLYDMRDGTYVFDITCFSANGIPTSDRQTVYVDSNNGNGNNNNNNDKPDADTEEEDEVTEDSAELNGSVDMNDFNNGIVFFVYGQDKNQIEDIERDYDRYSEVDEDGDDLQKVRVDNDLDGDDDYAEDVDNLDRDEKYYYQICVEYDNDNNREELECGGVESFTTDDNGDDPTTPDEPRDPSRPNNPDPVATTPTIITLPESGLSQTTAVINGGYNARGCDNFKTHFLVGTRSTNLSIDTPFISRGNTNGIAREQLSSLVPGANYYYQFVGNCDGIPIYGNIESFRTLPRLVERPTNPVTPVVPVTPVTTTVPTIQVTTLEAGTGLGCLDLDITNNTDAVSRGQQTTYIVSWNNLCDQDFEDAVLDVKLPKDLNFIATNRGTYTGANEHSIVVRLGDLSPQEDDTMMITTQMRVGAAAGEMVVVEATMAGDGVGNNIQDTATEFDLDNVIARPGGVGLGAFALGTGFLFGGVWGWILLLFLLVLVILAARYFYVKGARNERAYAYAPRQTVAPGYAHAAPTAAPVYAQPAPAPAPAPAAPAPTNLPQEPEVKTFTAPDYTTYQPKPFDGSK